MQRSEGTQSKSKLHVGKHETRAACFVGTIEHHCLYVCECAVEGKQRAEYEHAII